MKCLEECSIESATTATFSCAVLLPEQPDLLLFNDVCRMLETQRHIVFLVGIDHDDLVKSLFLRNAGSLRPICHSLQTPQQQNHNAHHYMQKM